MDVQYKVKMDVRQDCQKSIEIKDNNNKKAETDRNSVDTHLQNANESNPLAPKIVRSDDEATEETPGVTNFTLLCNAWSIVSSLIFFTGNIRLVIEYWTTNKNEHLIFVIGVIIITSIAIAGVSAKMRYYEPEIPPSETDYGSRTKKYLKTLVNLKVPFFWLAVLLQADIPLRCIRRLWYGITIRMYGAEGNMDRLRHYNAMVKDNADLALLDIIRSFLASALQLILQLTLFINQGLDSVAWWQMIVWCFVPIGLASSMKEYHCAVRLAQPNKRRITITGQVVMFLWYFGTIGARILLTAIAGSNWPLHTLLFCTLNWFGWTLWIYIRKDGVLNFCRDGTRSELTGPTRLELLWTFLFSAVLGVVYMFTVINVKEGSTFFRYCFYYVLMTLQNGTMFILYIYFGNLTEESLWILDIFRILSVIMFFAGIAAMVMYYMFLQPTVKLTKVTCCSA